MIYMSVSKNRGENDGKAYFLMDDLGVALFLETPAWFLTLAKVKNIEGLTSVFAADIERRALSSRQLDA